MVEPPGVVIAIANRALPPVVNTGHLVGRAVAIVHRTVITGARIETIQHIIAIARTAQPVTHAGNVASGIIAIADISHPRRIIDARQQLVVVIGKTSYPAGKVRVGGERAIGAEGPLFTAAILVQSRGADTTA